MARDFIFHSHNTMATPTAPLYKLFLDSDEQFGHELDSVYSNLLKTGVKSGSNFFQEIHLPNLKVGDEVVWLRRRNGAPLDLDIFNRLDIGKVQKIICHINENNESKTLILIIFHDEVVEAMTLVSPLGKTYHVLLVDINDVQRLEEFIEAVNSGSKTTTKGFSPTTSSYRSESGLNLGIDGSHNNMRKSYYLARPCTLMEKVSAYHSILTEGRKIINLKLDGPIPTAVRGTVKRVFSNKGELYIGAEFDQEVYSLDLDHSPSCSWMSNGCNRRLAINLVYLTKNAWDTEFRLFVHNAVVSFEELFQHQDPAPPSYADAVSNFNHGANFPAPSSTKINFEIKSNKVFQSSQMPPAISKPPLIPVQRARTRDPKEPVAVSQSNVRMKGLPTSFLDEMQQKFKSKQFKAPDSSYSPPEPAETLIVPPVAPYEVRSVDRVYENIIIKSKTLDEPVPIPSSPSPVPVLKNVHEKKLKVNSNSEFAEKRALVQKLFDKSNGTNPGNGIRSANDAKPRPKSMGPSEHNNIPTFDHRSSFPVDFSHCPQPIQENRSNKPKIGRKPSVLPKPAVGPKPPVSAKPSKPNTPLTPKPEETSNSSPLSFNKSFLFDSPEPPVSRGPSQKPTTPPTVTHRPLSLTYAHHEESTRPQLPVEMNPHYNPSHIQSRIEFNEELSARTSLKSFDINSNYEEPPPLPERTAKVPDPHVMMPINEIRDSSFPDFHHNYIAPIDYEGDKKLSSRVVRPNQPPQPPPPPSNHLVPPPPPPPSAPTPPSNPSPRGDNANSSAPDRSNLLDEIRRGTTLRKTSPKQRGSLSSIHNESKMTDSSNGAGGLASLLMDAMQHRRFNIGDDQDDDDSDEWDNNYEDDDAWD